MSKKSKNGVNICCFSSLVDALRPCAKSCYFFLSHVYLIYVMTSLELTFCPNIMQELSKDISLCVQHVFMTCHGMPALCCHVTTWVEFKRHVFSIQFQQSLHWKKYIVKLSQGKNGIIDAILHLIYLQVIQFSRS